MTSDQDRTVINVVSSNATTLPPTTSDIEPKVFLSYLLGMAMEAALCLVDGFAISCSASLVMRVSWFPIDITFKFKQRLPCLCSCIIFSFPFRNSSISNL